MKNIELINASAGSGKTYNLTSRVVDILKNGIPPEALMVTTFTNRAAAELRERIRVQLLNYKQTEEANRIDDGFIGTVNSICARLLKEYALEAGISPAIVIMPEEDSTVIFRQSIDRVITQYADRMEPAARRMDLFGSNHGLQSTDDWRDHVRKIVELARSNQITPDQLKACSQSSWEILESVFSNTITRDLTEELHDAIKHAIFCLNQLQKLTKTTQKALDFIKECEKCIIDNRLPWSDWVRLTKIEAAKDGKNAIDLIMSVADSVLQHPQFQADIKQIIEGAFDCAIEALQEYDAYKQKHGLMDFTDQETRILDMAQHNASFQSSISDRIRALMVDEFQDTSPIQLALFLALNTLAGRSVWVGDPKQAIYGFRGTDPQLMEEVVSLIGESKVLDCSWRSKENLLDFTNALFSEVFHLMGRDKVCLKVPAERAVKAIGGCLEAWHLTAKNNNDEAMALANGIRDLINRVHEIKPGDIAVLCRTNNNCVEIAACLELLGVRVSVGQGLLLDTRECQLALAALRYMNNQYDLLALAEINQLVPKNVPGEDWLAELMSDPEKAKEKWHNDTLVAALNDGRCQIKYWTPLESLEQAISRINLLRMLKSWPNPNLARSNLDALRKTCNEYIDLCSSRRSAATVDGFVKYLKVTAVEQAQGIGEQTVNVLTYHKAKGLEWPWVVLSGLDKDSRADVFGVNIEAASQFNPVEPLADRNIRYWPWPFGTQRLYPTLDNKINTLPHKQQALEKAEREEQRLMYVGMTRAKDGLVMAMRKTTTSSGTANLKTGWLDALKDASGECVIKWNTGIADQTIQVGKAQIQIKTYEYNPEDTETLDLVIAEDEYLPALQNTTKVYPAARVAPSSVLCAPINDDSYSWEIVEEFNARVIIRGNPEMDMLGSAIHTYLAFDYASLSEDNQRKLAQSIMQKWGMEAIVDSSEIVAAGQRLIEFVCRRYFGCTVFREWPISMRNQEGQHIQGWIDLLLDTPDGYVIIDHKDYPGQKIQERLNEYVPQLKTYKEAVEQATGKPVIDVLVHLPISGRIFRLYKAP